MSTHIQDAIDGKASNEAFTKVNELFRNFLISLRELGASAGQTKFKFYIDGTQKEALAYDILENIRDATLIKVREVFIQKASIEFYEKVERLAGEVAEIQQAIQQ